MNVAEHNRFFRLMHDTAKYIEQNCEAYNSTVDRMYLQFIFEDAKKVQEYAKLLLESDTE